ncbi:holin [Pseudoalteromonas phage vB_Pun_Y3]
MKTLNDLNNGPWIMDKQTTVASYAASIGTAAGGLMSLNTIALLLGIAFTAATFFINWRSQKRRIELKELSRKDDAEYHRARMARLLESDNNEYNKRTGKDDRRCQ